MTSEIEEAVARLRRHAVEAYGDLEDDLLSAIDALSASQAEVERLTQESADLTKALTGLTRQGSEFFVQRGKRFVADIPACVQDVRERMQRAQQAAVNFARDKQAAEALATRAEGLLAEAGPLIERGTLAISSCYTSLHADARAFLAKLKEQGQ